MACEFLDNPGIRMCASAIAALGLVNGMKKLILGAMVAGAANCQVAEANASTYAFDLNALGLLGWRKKRKAAARTGRLMAITSLVVFFGLSSQAPANTVITYDIGTTTANFSGGTDTVTGTFTVDFTTNALTAFNINVSGAVILGASPFTVPNNFSLSGTPTFVSGQATSGIPAGEVLQLVLQNPLGNSPDPITQVNFRNGAVSFTDTFSTSVTGTATPQGVSAVPLPAALPLFASGLAGLGLLGWRRKKKAAA